MDDETKKFAAALGWFLRVKGRGKEIAEKAGVTDGYVRNIAQFRRSGTLNTLKKIQEAVATVAAKDVDWTITTNTMVDLGQWIEMGKDPEDFRPYGTVQMSDAFPRAWVDEWLDVEFAAGPENGLVIYERLKGAFPEFARYCEGKANRTLVRRTIKG